MPICNAVLEGGGIKGIAYAGAVCALEEQGYRFDLLAGSSAGAIVAALISAGYTGKEMELLLKEVDYLRFKKEDFLDKLGTGGKLLSILFHYGIYSSSYLETWLQGLLMKKGISRFQDVKKKDGTYRLRVTAVDLTRGELLVFPDDLKKFHFDADSFSIAKAVRMSMSIPLFYEPYRLSDACGNIHYMVDGGMVSNYPIWILDNGQEALKTAVFGLKFHNEEKKDCLKEEQACRSFLDYSKLLVSALLDAGDHIHVSTTKGDRERSIFISSVIGEGGSKKAINTIDFDITAEESEALFENGRAAAKQFLKHWDFEIWKRKYRKN